MDIVKYRKARWYAFKVCTFGNPLDLVHDAYVKWYNRKDTDLFDQDIALIYHTIKSEYYQQMRRETTYKWREERAPRQWISLSDHNESGNPIHELIENRQTDELVIYNQLRDKFIYKINKLNTTSHDLPIQTFNLMLKGYRAVEIEKELGGGRNSIHRMVNTIRKTVIS